MLYVFILDSDAGHTTINGIETRHSFGTIADDYEKALDNFLEWCDQNDLTEWCSHFEVVIPENYAIAVESHDDTA